MTSTSRTMPERPAFLESEYRFAAHIRDPDHTARPDDIEDRRMAIYRDLLFNNVESFIASGFPVLREITPDDRWDAMVRDFFARHRSRTPLFMEIPREFLAYLDNERGEVEGDPPFLRELAHYEWVELALSIAEDPPRDERVDPAGDLLDNRPAVSLLAWPLSYTFPVHRIGPDVQPDQPAEQPTHLLVYRDWQDEVGFIELNTVSARLMGLLLEENCGSGRQALEQIATELQHPNPAAVIAGGADILGQWREFGVLLGTISPLVPRTRV